MSDLFNEDIGIISTGKYLPSEVIPNSKFEGRELFNYDITGRKDPLSKIECKSEWIEKTTGIVERRRAGLLDDAASMGAASIEDALKKMGEDSDFLRGIIGATVTSNRYPSAACKVGKILEVEGNRFDFPAFDLGAACAGYPMAITTAASLMAAGQMSGPVAVFSSEYLTREVDYRDKISPLFGDGAGCAIVGRLGNSSGLEGRIIASSFGSCFDKGDKGLADNGIDLISRDSNGRLRMPNGQEVFKMAVSNMKHAVKELKEKTGWSNKDIDLVIPHQANLRILKSVARKSGLPWEKVFNNISKYGNMSSATCAVALDEAIEEGRIKEGSNVVVVSFGSGLVTSAVALDY